MAYPTLLHRLREWARPVPYRKPPPLKPVPAPITSYPASHDIPLGWMIDDTGRHRLIAYGPKNLKSLVTIAPARSGKTLTQLGMELVTYGGFINGIRPSVVVNDSKGELCPISARARCLLGDLVYRLDPFGTVLDSPWCQRARINLLDGMTPDSPTFISDIETLAAALIIDEGKDPHWTKRARQLVACILAHLCSSQPPGTASLPDLMRVLGQSPEVFRAYMENLAASPIRMVRNVAGQFAEESKEVASIVSTAVGQLGFLNDDNIAACLEGPSSFTWDQVKRGGITLYVCLPEAEAKAYGRFTRAIFACCMKALYRPPQLPCLLLLDEIATAMSGAVMDLLLTCFALGSGAGIRIHAVFQDLQQVHTMFGPQAHTLLSASGVRQFFRPNDEVTARHLAERCGRRTVSLVHETTGVNTDPRGQESMSHGYSVQHYDRPLITDYELYEMPNDRQVLIFEGLSAPVFAWRYPYPMTPWADRFDENPFYQAERGRSA